MTVALNWPQDIQRLQSVLERRNPRRAAGGRNALAGLGYQAHVVILAAVRSFAIDIDTETPAARPVFPETGSDYAQVIDEHTVVTCQVKQTLDSGTLKKALNELLDVYVAADEECPEIRDRLRFQITCLRRKIVDWRASAEGWADRHDDPQNRARALLKVLTLTEEPDPLAEVVCILANELRVPEPYKLVDRWVSDIIDHATGEIAATHLAKDFARDLSEAVSKDDALPFVVLSPDDREPENVTEQQNGFLIGEQPTLAYLSEGFFAPNPEVERVESTLWDWYEGLLLDPVVRLSGRIPLFWVKGPSGSGKSILHLQLLARLNRHSDVTVLCLTENTSLEEAVRFARSFGGRRRVVIGLDDPFAGDLTVGGQEWQKAKSLLAFPRGRGQLDHLPIFVFCGPTEQLDDFTENYGADVAPISHHHSIPTPQDVDRLRTWYRIRTGDDRQLPVAEPGLLPLQLFFEWWQREGVRDFARRFRSRLRRFGLPPLIAVMDRVLAVNRLYVGYPAAAVKKHSDRLRDRLAFLETEMHVSQRATGRRGYWLSHPHLADLMYQTWHEAGKDDQRRAGHLRDALRDAVNADEDGTAHVPILRALTSVLSVDATHAPPSAVERRVTTGAARAAVQEAGKLASRQPDALGFSALAAWVQTEAVAPGAVGSWKPATVAMARLNGHVALPLGIDPLVAALIDHTGPRELEAVLAFLDEHRFWPMWPSMMLRLLRRRLPLDLGRHVAAGVALDVDDQERADLLALAVREWPHDEAVLALARDLLTRTEPPRSQLGALADAMVMVSARERGLVINWLDKACRPENGQALATLLDRRDVSALVIDLARKWFIRHTDDESASAILRAILSWARMAPPFQAAVKEHLRTRAPATTTDVVSELAKLLARPEHQRQPSWTYVFDVLPPHSVAKSEIQEIGRSWLRDNRDSKGWTGVWILLARAAPGEDTELTDLGLAHLPEIEKTESWPQVSRLLLSVCSAQARPALVEQIREWLVAHPFSVSGWGYLFPVALRVSVASGRTVLLESAIDWLDHHFDARHWSYVWRAAAEEPGPAMQTLIDIAAKWLKENRSGWGYVVRDFLEITGTADGGIELARPWLASQLSDDNWPAVLSKLVPQLPERDVSTLASAWLRQARQCDSETGYLWKILVEDGTYPGLLSGPDFRGGVLDWLRGGYASKTWWHIWSAMHAADPTSTELIEIGVNITTAYNRHYAMGNRLSKSAQADPRVAEVVWQVLAAVTAPGPAWVAVWVDVGRVDHADSRFWNLGLWWLEEIGDARLLPFVWKTLWDLHPDRRIELEERGVRWCVAEMDRFGWASVWKRLAESGSPPKRAHLAALARTWLSKPRLSAGSKHRERVVELLETLTDELLDHACDTSVASPKP